VKKIRGVGGGGGGGGVGDERRVTLHILKGNKHVLHTNPVQANSSAEVGLGNLTELRHNTGRKCAALVS
jgi:hypothetical protein